jgi:hypothetical protein
LFGNGRIRGSGSSGGGSGSRNGRCRVCDIEENIILQQQLRSAEFGDRFTEFLDDLRKKIGEKKDIELDEEEKEN